MPCSSETILRSPPHAFWSSARSAGKANDLSKGPRWTRTPSHPTSVTHADRFRFRTFTSSILSHSVPRLPIRLHAREHHALRTTILARVATRSQDISDSIAKGSDTNIPPLASTGPNTIRRGDAGRDQTRRWHIRTLVDPMRRICEKDQANPIYAPRIIVLRHGIPAKRISNAGTRPPTIPVAMILASLISWGHIRVTGSRT
jgi:hypothetical protein